ncbi:MAG: hypothetical protein KDA79_01760 [Planctomycetaceae bacterium]|nr:hypothetical protein [Planctomycetaceae bacterium]
MAPETTGNSLLLEELRRYLDALQLTQKNLTEVLASKRKAIEQAQSERLQTLGPYEEEAVRRMQLLSGERKRLLEVARQQNLPSDNLRNLVRAIGGEQRDALLARMEQASQSLTTIRRESATHWIAARRGLLQYTELLELIARRGRKASGYSAKEQALATGGGLLDTTV